MKSSVVDQLRVLDSAPSTTAVAAANDPQLLAILETSRTEVTASSARTAVHRSRNRALMGLAAAVAAAAVTIGILSPWSVQPAFASWTADPADLSAAQVAQRVNQCPVRYPDAGNQPLQLALADVRGEFTFVIRTNGDVLVQCYLQTSSDGTALATTAQAGPIKGAPVASGITTVSAGVTIWNTGPSGGGAVALAYGRAAPDVRSVSTVLGDGRTVTATVAGGWWAMWVPGDTALPASATIGLADGSRVAVTLHQPN